MKDNLLTGESYKQEKEKKELLKKEKFNELADSFNYVFSTTQGKVLGEWLIRQCGFFENSVVCGSNGILPNETIYNEARRGIYLELRKYFNSETLINLEIKENK